MARIPCVLAGDVGGTKTLLALYRCQGEGLALIREARYLNADYSGLEAILKLFLQGEMPRVAGFGVAGPVVDGVCRATNLPWTLDAEALSKTLHRIPVRLLNDLEAAAYGVLHLPDESFHVLNPGKTAPGNMAVLAAGTGLGEAMLFWDGESYRAIAGEGGHSDFAPADALQDGLLAFLRERHGGHVSYERLLSGSGLFAIYQYLLASGRAAPNPQVDAALQREDPAAVVARFGLEQEDAACREALRLFARIYGQEAGNLALKCLPRSGVWIAGGMAPRLLPVLQEEDGFMAGFCDKGRFGGLLREMPVRVCLETRAPMLGAAFAAADIGKKPW